MNILRMASLSCLVTLVSCPVSAITFSPGGATAFGIHSPMALPPFTFVGRVSDYDHVAFDRDQIAEVRAYTTNGTLIAKSRTFLSAADSSYNFRLDVPVATAAEEGFIAPNTKVVLEFVDDAGRIFDNVVPADDAVVGEPGGSKKILAMLAEDSDRNGIADEKEYYYFQYAWTMGIPLYEFDADADYDGDGQCNRDEYVAGTHPFIAEDVFAIVDFSPTDDDGNPLDDWLKVGFVANNGRCYTLLASPSLGGGDQWRVGEFKYQPQPGSTSYSHLVTEGQETGWRWFYVQKDASRRFWRIKVE